MDKLIIIPSRRGSTRYHNKPMADINGKTLVRRVWECATSTGIPAIVCTESEEIKSHVEDFGGMCYMTSDKHECGTDRVREAFQIYCNKNKCPDIIINVQGDLPYISAEDILASIEPIQQGFDIGTLIYNMTKENMSNPNTVKTIATLCGNIFRCHWFLRASVSYGYHHAGVYSFTPNSLGKIFPISKLESLERLEQLRFIENGMTIGAAKINKIIKEVNTPEDVDSLIGEPK